MRSKLKVLVAVFLMAAMVFTMFPASAIAGPKSKGNRKPGKTVEETQAPETEIVETEAPTEEVETETVIETEAVETEAVETVQETEPPVEETEAAYPAWTFEGEDKESGISVTVDAPEGALPAGTEMKLTALTKDQLAEVSEKVDGNLVEAIDISFWNDDQEIEPLTTDSPIIVTMSSAKIAKVEDPTVVHIPDDDAEVEEVKQLEDAAAAANEVVFEADSFSVYAVVVPGSDDQNARVTVNFINQEGTTVATYYVKNADSLNEVKKIVTDPGVGTLGEGELFQGWSMDELKDKDDNYYNGPFTDENPKTYVGPDYTLKTAPMTIDEIRTYLESLTIHEGDVLNIYAMVFKYFTVTYYGLDADVSLGSDLILRLRDQTSSPYTVNMAFTAESNAKFMGWKAPDTYSHISGGTADTVYQNKQEITITGDVVFKVYAPIGNWLVYNNNGGGTYNAPEFYIGETPTKQAENAKPENMRRYGYTFGGWYTDKECTDGKEYGFNEVLPVGGRTIYAKWIENEKAPYTVLIWKQKLGTDGKVSSEYELFASLPSEGPIGENIPYQFVDDGDQDYVNLYDKNGNVVNENPQDVPDYQYKGFCLKSDIDAVPITVNGKAVLNLYYDRIQYNVRFYVYRDAGSGNNRYSYGNNSYAGNNVWGIVNWHTSRTEHPSLTTAGQNKYGALKHETVEGYDAYYFVISAYYGESIAAQWPTYDDIQGVGNNAPVSFVMMNGTKLKPNPSNQGDGTVKGIVSYLDENILGATNNSNGNFLIVRFNRYNSWTYHIMLEVLPDANGNYPAGAVQAENKQITNNKYYIESTADIVYTRSSNTTPDRQNAPKLNGYDTVMKSASVAYSDGYNSEVDDDGYNNTPELNYYYNLQTGHINYMDGVYVDGDDNQLKTNSGYLLHESEELAQSADLSDRNKGEEKYYTPNLPDGEEGFVFEGWYFDKACTQEYTFDTMPIGGIIVYAKWRQIEYRVFLHPNAGTSTSNPDLYWGSAGQSMNFRIAYGDKVSTPTGIWTDGLYEFVAWFTEDGQVFDGDVFELNETTVTEDYDKTLAENYTDEMDQWGNGATYNKDAQNDRWWITKKLDLYAQWREVTPGAKGIDVKYNAVGLNTSVTPSETVSGTVNGSAEYTDGLKYLDSAGAVATSAAVPPANSDVKFLYWVVQTWDEDAGEYVDVVEDGKKIEVFPGGDFTVYKKYSKVEVTEWKDKDGNTSQTESDVYNLISKATYTMYLRAEYGPKETPKDTFFNYYRNWDATDTATTGLLHKEEGLQINEAKDIYTLTEGIPTRPGYKFLGWMRDTEKTKADATVDETIAYHDYTGKTAEDCYIKWVEAEGSVAAHYEAKDDKGVWQTVTQVAADDLTPYQAFYAVWEAQWFYIYHSSTGELEAVNLDEVDEDGKYDLTAKIEDNTLYGGWFTACGGTTVEKVEATFDAAVAASNHKAAVDGAVTYDGKSLKNGTARFWTKATAGDVIGTKVEPEVNDVFYLKEVPTRYLKTNAKWVYDWSNNYKIEAMYFLTGIDEAMYSEVGFVIDSSNTKGSIVSAFSYQQRNSDTSTKIKASELIGQRGYIGVVTATDDCIDSIRTGTVVIKPYWITLDGVQVETEGYTLSCKESGAEMLTNKNISYTAN